LIIALEDEGNGTEEAWGLSQNFAAQFQVMHVAALE
jgi:hypothetical protein